MSRRIYIFAVGLAMICATPLAAHHSFAATYFQDKTITVEGDIVQFLFRNPHSFVQIEEQTSSGPVRWSIEWAAPGSLAQQGVVRDIFKAGDHVVVTGSPSRIADDHRMRLLSIVRPKDGWRWSGTYQ